MHYENTQRFTLKLTHYVNIHIKNRVKSLYAKKKHKDCQEFHVEKLMRGHEGLTRYKEE